MNLYTPFASIVKVWFKNRSGHTLFHRRPSLNPGLTLTKDSDSGQKGMSRKGFYAQTPIDPMPISTKRSPMPGTCEGPELTLPALRTRKVLPVPGSFSSERAEPDQETRKSGNRRETIMPFAFSSTFPPDGILKRLFLRDRSPLFWGFLGLMLSLSGGADLGKALAASPSAQSPAPTSAPVSDDPAALQKRFQKVILDSLARQRIPYRDFAWLAPKAVDNDILALPFSIIVGAQKIVLPVYIINHRYLVTTPLLDITRHYAVVPSIPPPQPVSLFIPSSTFQLDKFPSTGSGSAPHSVIMFGDEQCSVCRRWNREVQDKVTSDSSIHFTYIPYPQTTIHRNSLDAAIFEMCVYEEKPAAFWTIHNQLDQRVDLKNIDKSGLKPIFSGFMVQAGVPTPKVQACIDQSRPLPDISRAGDTLTSHIGVPSTPVFIVDGQVKSGYLSYDDIKQIFAQETPKTSQTKSN